jgi:hypothetical protein
MKNENNNLDALQFTVRMMIERDKKMKEMRDMNVDTSLISKKSE